MSFFKYDDKKIFYVDKGEGEPLVLLPGNTASSAVHEKDINFFVENNFRVICPDYIGYGKSDRLHEFPVDFWYSNAKIIIKLIESINIENYNLLGTSGGALVALNISALVPENIKSIIADSFRLKFNELDIEKIISERKNITKEQKMFWQYAHGSDWKEVIEKDTNIFVKMLENDNEIIKNDLNNIYCPVLLTGSIKDNLIPDVFDNINYTLQKIENSKAIIYSQGDHPIIWSQATNFRQDVLNFLKSMSE